MSQKTASSGGPQKKSTAQGLLIVLVLLAFFTVYIYIGYRKQTMEQYEKSLKEQYERLRGTYVATHKDMLSATDRENLGMLIKKYRLNIIMEKVTPIVVENDEKSN